MDLLGLTGFAQSGKDTVADYLVSDYGFQKVSFAAPLKDMLRRLNPIVGSQLVWNNHELHDGARPIRLEDLYEQFGDHEGVKKSPYGEEVRDLWQRLGTDCVRAVDDKFWVRAAMKDLHHMGRYVFPDTRFLNEAHALINSEAQFASVWRVSRPGVQAVNGHVSEQYVGKLGENATVTNDGTLEELYSVVDAYMRNYFGINKDGK